MADQGTTTSSHYRPARSGPRRGAAEPAGAAPRPARSVSRRLDDTERKLRELEFLHEFAQLATSARDWDELMRTLVDRTTVALEVEVCSFYLMDRDAQRLTLAATNGLDREQIGRVSLAVGQGITGIAAAERRPVEVPDVREDPRFAWVRGFDQAKFTSMLSVPLIWQDRVIGVLNVQTVENRRFSEAEVEFLVTIAGLLAAIVEKGRLQAEQERQLRTLTALDSARAELLSLVTHELRTPLSVVRAYLDLLMDAAAGMEEPPARASAQAWRDAAVEQVSRLDRLVDSILVATRGDGLARLSRTPFDVGAAVSSTVELLTVLFRAHPLRLETPRSGLIAIGDQSRFRQVLEHLLENEAKYAPTGHGVSIGAWREGEEIRVYVTDDGPGVPIGDWEAVFDPYVRIEGARPRGSGIGLFAARRLMDAMGGRVWIEPNGYGGSRFVTALPTADRSGGKA